MRWLNAGGALRAITCDALSASHALLQAEGDAGDAVEFVRGVLAFLRSYDRLPPTRDRSEDELCELGAAVELLLHAFDAEVDGGSTLVLSSAGASRDLFAAVALVRGCWERSFLASHVSTIVSLEPADAEEGEHAADELDSIARIALRLEEIDRVENEALERVRDRGAAS